MRAATTTRRARRAALLVALATVAVTGCSGGSRAARPAGRPGSIPVPTATGIPVDAGAGAATDPVPLTAAACLGRPSGRVQPVTGTVPTQLRADRPADATTYDLRAATFIGDGTVDPASGAANIYPILLGKQRPAGALCVVGGTVPGRLRPSMTWPQLKAETPQPDGHPIYFDAAALTEYAGGNAGHLVDGLRVDDVSDGVAARGSFATTRQLPLDGGNFFLEDAYFTNVHDDCVDVNDLTSGIVYDSLLDGCYTGISQRPDSGSPVRGLTAPPGSRLVLDHVLLRMQRFPGPHPTAACPGGTASGYNQPFKWSPGADRVVLRHVVIELDGPPCSDSAFPFPKDAVVRDVTIVWTGGARWRWPVPPGVRVTTDRSVWDAARVTWLRRHGCPDTSAGVAATTNACRRLVTPA